MLVSIIGLDLSFLLFDDVLFCLPFFCWCPCMVAINVVSVQYDGGFLPDIILLTQCYYVITIGEPVY